jgi:hypothetical protein
MLKGISSAILALLSQLIFSCNPKPIEENERFAHNAPIEDFDSPSFKENWILYTELDSFLAYNPVLPFSQKAEERILFSKDDSKIFVCVSFNQILLNKEAEEARKRENFYGISAFDLNTKTQLWHNKANDKSALPFQISDSTLIIMDYPYLIDDFIVVKKSEAQFKDKKIAVNILDKNSGKLLHQIGGLGHDFQVLNLQYLLHYIDRKNVAMIDITTGKEKWKYALNADATKNSQLLRMLDAEHFFYEYDQKGQHCFDIIQIETGEIIKKIQLREQDLLKTSITLLAFDGKNAFFRMHVCGDLNLKNVRSRDCEHYEIIWDSQTEKVQKRTPYKKGFQ